MVAFVAGTVAFLGLGVLLGIVTRNARAAQAVGMMLFFPSFLLAGAGPPPDVMSSGMRSVSDVLPLTWVVRSLQGPWLDSNLDWMYPGILLIMLVVAVGLTIRLYRTA